VERKRNEETKKLGGTETSRAATTVAMPQTEEEASEEDSEGKRDS
jgi:hypothetical protein